MAEPRSSDDLAQLLMEKAAGDEKILHDVWYERTHNIAYLLTLLDGASIPKPDNAANLPNLSPWALVCSTKERISARSGTASGWRA